MDPLLTLLQREARISLEDLAAQTGGTTADVAGKISQWETDGVILGYHAVVDSEKINKGAVTAVIEVRITPERGGGFDRLASRIAQFDQVQSCYLMSGSYDLLVVIAGQDLREVARFVSEKLSTLEGVLSTATHFRLKSYKESGILTHREERTERLPVAP